MCAAGGIWDEKRYLHGGAFVTGSAALLMEWGIIRGNDPYLYGEKMKAKLIRGARQLIGFERYPNRKTGWGALCVENSLSM